MATPASHLISATPVDVPCHEPSPETRSPGEARLLIRAMRPTDADALRAFHARLSAESVYLRYFSPHPQLSDDDVRRFTCVDGTDRLAVVAFDAVRLVGVARADRLGLTDRAEVAVIVADDLQQSGVGTALLERLVHDCSHVMIRVFEADTLMSNQKMLDVFHHLGFAVSSHLDTGVIHLTFPITTTADYERACQNRRTPTDLNQEPTIRTGTGLGVDHKRRINSVDR